MKSLYGNLLLGQSLWGSGTLFQVGVPQTPKLERTGTNLFDHTKSSEHSHIVNAFTVLNLW